MRLRPCSFARALTAIGILQVISASSEPAASTGEAAKAFANKASTRLRLLGDAAQQVLATPGVEEEPLFSKTLHKVQSQLQESATILQKWGTDYARNADANEMAQSLAEQGAVYEVQDLKKQLRAAIEADQEAQLEQPKRLAELTKKVATLRSKLDHLEKQEAHQHQKTALISDVWPRPPKNAKKAEIGLFMHGKKVRVNAKDQTQENEDHLRKLESKLGSLEKQLKEAQADVAASHEDAAEAHQDAQASFLQKAVPDNGGAVKR